MPSLYGNWKSVILGSRNQGQLSASSASISFCCCSDVDTGAQGAKEEPTKILCLR